MSHEKGHHHEHWKKAAKMVAAASVAGTLVTATPVQQALFEPTIVAEAATLQVGKTTDALNLRKGAGTKYGVKKVLPKGAVVTILKTSKTGKWLKVRCGGSTGWVSSAYVGYGEIGATTNASANFRSGAGTKYRIKQVLPQGTAVTIVKPSKTGKWLKVSVGGKQGWVSAKLIGPKATATPSSSPSTTTKSDSTYSTVLSTVTTYYDAGQYNRASNVELAARKIDGLILQPGQSYSFTNLVGPVTAGNGYLDATVFIGGGVGNGIGGGICQVSSTIYYAQLKAGIISTERHAHNLSVGYVPLGLDATMWEGSQDHRFTNPYDVPIQLKVSAGGGALTVEFRAQGDALKGYTSEPYTVLVSKSGGYETWDTYLRTYKNGSYVSEKYLHRSTYQLW